jgi:ADP-ribose pyrophosphatase YjhB (NUDIX family)
MPISPYLREIRRKIGHDLILMPAVCALVFDERGRILLCRSSDDGQWTIPGGSIDPGESPADCAEREILEEAAIRVEAQRIAGVYAGPLVKYANGDEVMYTTIAFVCRAIDQAPRVADDESLEIRFVEPADVPPLRAEQQRILNYVLANHHEPFFDRGGNVA